MSKPKSLFDNEEEKIVEVSIRVKASVSKKGLEIIDLDISNKPMLSLIDRVVMDLAISRTSKKWVARDYIERAMSLDKNEVVKLIQEIMLKGEEQDES